MNRPTITMLVCPLKSSRSERLVPLKSSRSERLVPLKSSRRSVLFVSNSPQKFHIVGREHSDLSVDLARPPAALVLARHAHLLSLAQRQLVRVLAREVVQHARHDSLRLPRRPPLFLYKENFPFGERKPILSLGRGGAHRFAHRPRLPRPLYFLPKRGRGILGQLLALGAGDGPDLPRLHPFGGGGGMRARRLLDPGPLSGFKESRPHFIEIGEYSCLTSKNSPKTTSITPP